MNHDNAMLAFNRKTEEVAEIQIIDLRCQDWNVLKDQYYTYIQGIRMVDCKQKNRWSIQPKEWSMVIIGMDKRGNVLFIFSRSPYRVHDLIEMILDLPLNIYNAMYLEGGPEASLYIKSHDFEFKGFGSYETDFYLDDSNDDFWLIPNVIGIVKK